MVEYIKVCETVGAAGIPCERVVHTLHNELGRKNFFTMGSVFPYFGANALGSVFVLDQQKLTELKFEVL